METKPREFWIDHDEWYSKEEKEFNERTCSKEEFNADNLVHVIEATPRVLAADDLVDALEYYFSVLEEVRGKDWDKKPDHVLAKMLNAHKKARGNNG